MDCTTTVVTVTGGGGGSGGGAAFGSGATVVVAATGVAGADSRPMCTYANTAAIVTNPAAAETAAVVTQNGRPDPGSF
ncbi:hypothetical protein [Mycobacterium sp. DL99]|uniref:hypothetical protein n=1 Tax=Mycobacterium sp. DL99 TaxID=2528957 RepID=UPI00257044BD|nr:hypothetical protein [Mycobacterium sp. DL99]